MILTHTLILWEEKKHGEGVAAGGGGLVREEETRGTHNHQISCGLLLASPSINFSSLLFSNLSFLYFVTSLIYISKCN
jgi:hypothetical protein